MIKITLDLRYVAFETFGNKNYKTGISKEKKKKNSRVHGGDKVHAIITYMRECYNKTIWTFEGARRSMLVEVYILTFPFKWASLHFPQWIAIFSVINRLIFHSPPPPTDKCLAPHMSAAILLTQAANQGNDMDPMHLDFCVAFDKCFTWCPWGWDEEMRTGSEDRKWSQSWMNNHSQRMLISFSVSTQRSLVACHRALPLVLTLLALLPATQKTIYKVFQSSLRQTQSWEA